MKRSSVDLLRIGTVLITVAAGWALRLIFDGFEDAILFASQGGPESYRYNFETAGRWFAPLIAVVLGAGIYVFGLAMMRRGPSDGR